MGLKKLISGIFSLIVVGICFLMLICILDFFNIVELPEHLSIQNRLAGNKTSLENPNQDLIDISYLESTDTQEIDEESDNTKEKNIVVQTKEEQEYDYESLYNQEYLDKIKNGSTDPNVNQSNIEQNPIQEQQEIQENEVDVSDSKRFYYNQLDDVSKKVYDSLFACKDELRTGTHSINFDLEFDALLHTPNGSEQLTDSFQLAINALTFDNPELFFINISKMYLLTETTKYTDGKEEFRVSVGSNNNVSYLNNQFYNLESVNIAVENVETIRANIIAQAKSKGNVKEQIKFVHNYLVDNVTYDQSLTGDNIYNVYGALGNGVSVCEGYARALKYILDEMNIPCIIVCGTAVNPNGEIENHAWNYVRVENRWYAVDATWDDPIIIGGGDLNDESRYSFFLVGRSKLFNDHTEDGFIVGDKYSFKYPTLSLADY